jgi:hypothetical protein
VKEKTVCPWCGHQVSLRFDGTMNKHGYAKNAYDLGSHRPKPCEGSGRKAKLGKEDPGLRLRTSIVE